MRRRSRKKTLKILHLFSPGHLITLAILFLCNRMSAEPGYLDFDNLPETNFTCAGKVIGGYYADLETSCQMFHVCTIGQLDEPMDIKFLCLNGTVFDQETRVCERVDEVDCSKSERFYYLNLELYGNTMVPMEGESSSSSSSSDAATIATASTTTKQPSSPPPTTTTTMRTTSTTTTTQKPPSLSQPTKHSNYPQGFNYQQSGSGQGSRNSASYTFNGTGYNYNEPKNTQSYPTTTYSTPHYVSSTLSPKLSSTPVNRGPPSTTPSSVNHSQRGNQDGGAGVDQTGVDEEGLEEGDYEYEDDYGVVTEQNQAQPQKPFSPQQFIFEQNQKKVESQNTPTKPAISFQQQRFQNNGNSHFSTNHQGTSSQQSSSNSQPQSQSSRGNSNGDQQSGTGNNKYNGAGSNKNYYIGSSASGQQSNDNSRDSPRQFPSSTSRPSSNSYNQNTQNSATNHNNQNNHNHHNHNNNNNNYNYPQQPQQKEHQSQKSSSAAAQQQQQSNQLPKRIPLLTLGQQQQQQLQNNINFQQQQSLTFRVRGSGFQLPGGPPPPPLSQPRPFAGYQRPPPPQIPLHLPPFESGQSLRDQKDLLGFEEVAESYASPQERKDTKRSDPGGSEKTRFNVNQLVERRNATVKAAVKSLREAEKGRDYDAVEDLPEEDHQQGNLDRLVVDAGTGEGEGELEEEEAQESVVREDSAQSGSQKKDSLKKYSTSVTMTTSTTATGSAGTVTNNKSSSSSQRQQKGGKQTYDKTLLIPQEKYKKTLPKIIITASASVSANGKKLNYSLGNVLSGGQGAELKIPPPTYDDYKEEDVVLDPFFQDVPKIKRH